MLVITSNQTIALSCADGMDRVGAITNNRVIALSRAGVAERVAM